MTPMADPARAGACIAVIVGETKLIFDVGSGSMRVLGRMSFPVGKTERLSLEGTDDVYDGDIRISRDGDRISLPAGGTPVDYENMLF